MTARRLPAPSLSPLSRWRTETGTSARSSRPCVRTPRECSQWRSAPATTVSTTSLTVPPKAFLTALKSASSHATPAKRRCGPISTFSGDGGAGLAAAQTISPSPSAVIFASSIARSGRAQRAQRLGGDAERGLRHPGDAGGQQVERARLGVGHPRLEALLGRATLGAEVEEHRAEVDAGDAVDHRVMALGQQREAAVGEPLDEPQLPQRLGAVELLGEHARGEVRELLVAAGRGQRGVAHVVLEVEVARRRPTAAGRSTPAGRRAAGGSAARSAAARGSSRGSRRRAAPGPPRARARRCACASRVPPGAGRTRRPR